MKKVLLGTTALVAASAMTVDTAKAEIGLSMWAYQSFGLAIDSDNQTSDTGLVSYQNGNIDFKASGELDNGMTTGMSVDMVTANGSGAIDELKFSLSDDWGSIILGNDDSAADLVNGVYWVTGNGVNSGVWGAYTANTVANYMYTASSSTGDAAGIRYFTPSMSGFRLGVSYQPGSDDGGDSSITSAQVFENVLSVGAEYKGDMDGVGIGLSAGVDHTANLRTSQTASTATAGADDSTNQWFARGSVSTGGFMVGLAYAAEDYDLGANLKQDRWTFAATASYSTGPHTIGIEYATAELDTTKTTANDTTEGNAYLIGYNNSLGGGVYWDARLAVMDHDASGTANDADIMVFETGVGMSF